MTDSLASLVPRTAGLLRLLRRRLRAAEPLAAALVRDPGLAERTETYPYDHDVTDVLIAIDRLLRALHQLQDATSPVRT